MSKKYKLVYKKAECIGAGACEHAYPEGWHFDIDTNIATLKDPNAQKTDKEEILIFDEADLEKHLEGAQVCPVHIIEIYELESGKKVYPEE